MDRRQFLVALTSLPFAAATKNGALAQPGGPNASADVVAAARILTGRASLSEAAIARAATFQGELDKTFPDRLAALAKAISGGASKDREAAIAGLSQADAATAVQLISPLYLGYTGAPSTDNMVDNAKFVTFLEALMFEPTADNVPRPSYAIGGPNYWAAVPHGVTAPPMSPDILAWGSKSPKAAKTYATPDPRYVAMCQGHGKTLAEAEAWLAANPGAIEPVNMQGNAR